VRPIPPLEPPEVKQPAGRQAASVVHKLLPPEEFSGDVSGCVDFDELPERRDQLGRAPTLLGRDCHSLGGPAGLRAGPDRVSPPLSEVTQLEYRRAHSPRVRFSCARRTAACS
jgi:hypothetical protein